MIKKIIAIGLAILYLGLCNAVVGASNFEEKIIDLTEVIDRDSLYNFLEPGDIIIYIPTFPKQVGHSQLFKEYNPTTGKYTIVESSFSVVEVESFTGVFEDDVTSDSILRGCLTFGMDSTVVVRVNATDEQKQNAIKFAEQLAGKKFDFQLFKTNKNYNPFDSNDPTANYWYCSEIVWAAYYNCNGTIGKGIDIDYNGWEKDIEDRHGNKYSSVMPLDITADDDVQVFRIYKNNMPFFIKYIRTIKLLCLVKAGLLLHHGL